MTRYTVTWQADAEAELTEIWLSASDRDEVTAAVRVIDDALSNDAESKGDTAAEGLRSFNAPPLRVLFLVREGDRLAEVELVRRI